MKRRIVVSTARSRVWGCRQGGSSVDFGGNGLLRTLVVALSGGRGRLSGCARAGGGRRERARRRTRVSRDGDGGGYQAMRWSNSKAGAGGCDAGWRGRLTEVAEDVAHGRAVGDEGDDPHRTATAGTQQRENFAEASEQQRPGLTCGATMLRDERGAAIAHRPRHPFRAACAISS